MKITRQGMVRVGLLICLIVFGVLGYFWFRPEPSLLTHARRLIGPPDLTAPSSLPAGGRRAGFLSFGVNLPSKMRFPMYYYWHSDHEIWMTIAEFQTSVNRIRAFSRKSVNLSFQQKVMQQIPIKEIDFFNDKPGQDRFQFFWLRNFRNKSYTPQLEAVLHDAGMGPLPTILHQPPNHAKLVDYTEDPTHSRFACLLETSEVPIPLQMLHRVLPAFNVQPQKILTLWIGDKKSGKMRRIGWVAKYKDDPNPFPFFWGTNLQWSPDGKQLSLFYDGTLYLLPAR